MVNVHIQRDIHVVDAEPRAVLQWQHQGTRSSDTGNIVDLVNNSRRVIARRIHIIVVALNFATANPEALCCEEDGKQGGRVHAELRFFFLFTLYLLLKLDKLARLDALLGQELVNGTLCGVQFVRFVVFHEVRILLSKFLDHVLARCDFLFVLVSVGRLALDQGQALRARPEKVWV